MRRGLRAQSPPEVIPGRVSVQRSLVESCKGVSNCLGIYARGTSA